MKRSCRSRPEHTEVGHDSHDHADHGGNGKYLLVFVALCVLTMGSFLTYFRFGEHVSDARQPGAR